MEIREIPTRGEKIVFSKNGREIARVSIFLIQNSRDKPYALLEDVFVQEDFRGQGHGRKIVEAAIERARELGCYKVLGTSRHSREKVHQLYEKIGFENWGKEFRMNL